jgi:ketosteroid isomerase-like protein
MKSIHLSLLIIFGFNSVTAQNLTNKSLESLIETELAFARMAKEKNTRDAFLKYLSDETVMFMNSKITKGKQLWESRKPDSSLIVWEPVFADISSSGDFGYTAGPSEFYPTRKPGEQAFYGAYITVWEKQTKKDWKMALDIGVYPQPKPATKRLETPAVLSTYKVTKKVDSRSELLDHEKKFMEEVSNSSTKQFDQFISTESHFYRSGIEPISEMRKINQLLTDQIGRVEYSLVDGEVSSTADMGYVYGIVKIKETGKVIEGFYLRIYKRENQKDWKIVLDAIHQ